MNLSHIKLTSFGNGCPDIRISRLLHLKLFQHIVDCFLRFFLKLVEILINSCLKLLTILINVRVIISTLINDHLVVNNILQSRLWNVTIPVISTILNIQITFAIFPLNDSISLHWIGNVTHSKSTLATHFFGSLRVFFSRLIIGLYRSLIHFLIFLTYWRILKLISRRTTRCSIFRFFRFF